MGSFDSHFVPLLSPPQTSHWSTGEPKSEYPSNSPHTGDPLRTSPTKLVHRLEHHSMPITRKCLASAHTVDFPKL